MDDRIRAAFDAIHAEEALKEHTKAALAARQRPAVRRRRLAPLLACLALVVVLLGGGGWLWFTPTASVSVDINPSLELRLNRFSRVVAVEGANADGQALAQELDLRFLDCAAALEAILASDTVSALLAQDSALTIAVSGQDEAQCQDLLTQAQHCTAGQENAHCFSASSQEHDEAHQAGLTLGKYRAYLALHDLDPTVTPEEVQSLTMAEIRDRIQALGGTLPTGAGEHSQTQAGHHGQGHHMTANGRAPKQGARPFCVRRSRVSKERIRENCCFGCSHKLFLI